MSDRLRTNVIQHRKLVRDKVPAKIAANGHSCSTIELTPPNQDPEPFVNVLLQKLKEETAELSTALEDWLPGPTGGTTRANILEELGDIAFTFETLRTTLGFGALELNDEICRKNRIAGVYTDRIYLVDTWEESNA